jgi:hypothetical protein
MSGAQKRAAQDTSCHIVDEARLRHKVEQMREKRDEAINLLDTLSSEKSLPHYVVLEWGARQSKNQIIDFWTVLGTNRKFSTWPPKDHPGGSSATICIHSDVQTFSEDEVEEVLKYITGLCMASCDNNFPSSITALVHILNFLGSEELLDGALSPKILLDNLHLLTTFAGLGPADLAVRARTQRAHGLVKQHLL